MDNVFYALAAASIFCNLLGFWIITSQYNEIRRLRRRQLRLEDKVIHYVHLVDELKHISKEEAEWLADHG